MRFLLFNIDGRKTSGIASFCKRMAEYDPSFFTVSLEMDSSSAASSNEVCIPAEHSHDSRKLVERVSNYVQSEGIASGDWVLVPNVGVVCYEAVLLLTEKLVLLGATRVGILAVCHSDDVNQYRVLSHFKRQVGAVLSVSPYIKSRLRRLLPDFEEEQLGCLQIPLPREIASQGRATKEGELLTIAYSGRFDIEQKRIDRLVEVLTELLKRRLDFRFLAFGGGRDRAYFERAVQELGARYAWEAFQIEGALPQAELFERMARADVVALVSEYEGTPLAIVEAMGMGLCPVVMDFDSLLGNPLREKVALVDQGDVSAFADMVCSLNDDRSLLARLSEECYMYAKSEYTAEKALSQLQTFGELAMRRGSIASEAPPPFGADLLEALAIEVSQRFNRQDRIGVFGIGMFGRALIDRLYQLGLAPSVLMDTDSRKWGSFYREGCIVGLEQGLAQGMDGVVIASESFAAEMSHSVESFFKGKGIAQPLVIYLRGRGVAASL